MGEEMFRLFGRSCLEPLPAESVVLTVSGPESPIPLAAGWASGRSNLCIVAADRLGEPAYVEYLRMLHGGDLRVPAVLQADEPARTLFETNRSARSFFAVAGAVRAWMMPLLIPDGILFRLQSYPVKSLEPRQVSAEQTLCRSLMEPPPGRLSFQTLHARESVLSPLLLTLGRLYEQHGLLEEAEEAYRTALTAGTSAPELQYAMANLYIRRDRVRDAEALLPALSQSDEYWERTRALIDRIAAYKKTAPYRTRLEQSLSEGDLDNASARDLVGLYRDQNKQEDLLAQCQAMLSRSNALSAGACLSVARIGVFLDPRLVAEGLRGFLSRAPRRGNVRDYLDAAALLLKQGDPQQAASLLESYLASEPDADAAWLELAAVRSATDDGDAAMKALRRAVELGGNAVRDRVQKDPRFDPLRSRWSFRRLMRRSE
jgi:thioredoxin-like negative regulator of GroEL